MKLKFVISTWCCLAYFINGTCGIKVLLLFPLPTFSHHILGSKLAQALTTKGNEVTFVSSFEEVNLSKGIRHIYTAEIKELFEERSKESVGFVGASFALLRFLGEVVERLFSNEEVQKLVNNPKEKFDVVVVDEVMCQPLKVFAYHFDAALVSFSSLGPTSFIDDLVGNPHPWSYVPNLGNSYGSSHMNLWQRTLNVLADIGFRLIEGWLILPEADALIQKYFPGAPNCNQLTSNISIILLNSHVSTNSPVPLLPNMIEIGGYHVDPPKKLPNDLQEYLDNSIKGVVYFSMGSIYKGIFMDENIRNAMMNKFAKLDLNILWKFENETIHGKPPNVKIAKWVPQQDVLAHPNVKLFISHGGLLSTIEAAYHGLPILGIPAFGDQIMNIAMAVSKGYAVQLNMKRFSEETFSEAIDEILTNPKYSLAAKQRQKLMLDRQVTPKETAVYWIEYAARHKGERHFRSAALDLAWYELYMVDVGLLLAAIVFTLVYITIKLIRLWISKARASARKARKAKHS